VCVAGTISGGGRRRQIGNLIETTVLAACGRVPRAFVSRLVVVAASVADSRSTFYNAPGDHETRARGEQLLPIVVDTYALNS